MVYYKIVLGVCILLLLVVHATLAAARKSGNRRQARMLHLFRLGLSLSAISYLLRITDAPRVGNHSFLLSVICLAGTTYLWLGWIEYWRLRAAHTNTHLNTRLVSQEEQDEPVSETLLPFAPVAGSSALTARAHQVLLQAQYEACRRHECCVDTDHLLIGLLRDSGSAGVHVLENLGVGPERVHLELLGQMAPGRTFTKQPKRMSDTALRTKAEPLALTDRADQVLALAAQEAHRFGKAAIGTEHLLLGLVLVGKGKAAAALFGEGITADGLRDQIIKAKKAA